MNDERLPKTDPSVPFRREEKKTATVTAQKEMIHFKEV